MITNTVYWQLGTLAAGATLTVLLLLIGHWFPWVRKLSRIQAYTYGVASILLGFTLWRLLNHDWQTVAGLLFIVVFAGIAVRGAYLVDQVVIQIRQAGKAERNDSELT